MPIMNIRAAAVLAGVLLTAAYGLSSLSANAAEDSGVVRVKSSYSADETIERLKADIAKKGIKFFSAIDQQQLGAEAGLSLNRSTLLLFGNPALGVQFLTANPEAGLDWPVRLLVIEDSNHQVWAVYNDFGWIKKRHAINGRDPQFKMATEVISSITSSVSK